MIISRKTIIKRAHFDAMTAAHKPLSNSEIADPPLAYPCNTDAQAEYAQAYTARMTEYGVLAAA